MTTSKHGNNRQIRGGTDQTEIGNLGDRLKVDSVSRGSPAPDGNVIHVPSYVTTSGGSNVLEVNGAVTPVVFTYTPGSTETWYLQGLDLILIDPGTMDAGNFGSIAGLTNGLLIEVRAQGTLYTICNLQNNLDLSVLFSGGGTGTAVSGLLGLVSADGFLDSIDAYRGQLGFSPPIRINGSSSDFIRATVRDNLTGVQDLRLVVKKYRIIS